MGQDRPARRRRRALPPRDHRRRIHGRQRGTDWLEVSHGRLWLRQVQVAPVGTVGARLEERQGQGQGHRLPRTVARRSRRCRRPRHRVPPGHRAPRRRRGHRLRHPPRRLRECAGCVHPVLQGLRPLGRGVRADSGRRCPPDRGNGRCRLHVRRGHHHPVRQARGRSRSDRRFQDRLGFGAVGHEDVATAVDLLPR